MDAKRKTFYEVLLKNFGNVTKACEHVGIARKTYYEWLKVDQEFKEACDGIGEVNLDFVEDALYKLIRKGDKAATIFYLKTKGKHRGFVERQEITHTEPPRFVMYDARGKGPDKEDSE